MKKQMIAYKRGAGCPMLFFASGKTFIVEPSKHAKGRQRQGKKRKKGGTK